MFGTQWPAAVLYVTVVLSLLGVYVLTTHRSGFRLEGDALASLAITPATTISHAHRHLTAAFFHTNPVHLGFNLAVFTVGFWLAQRGAGPVATLVAAYFAGVATVLLVHLALVIPLAGAEFPYALEALRRPLVGFSVVAYATLGMGLNHVPPFVLWATVSVVVLFEFLAGLWVTAPFIFVYHLCGLGAGFYVRWVLLRPM